MVLKPSLLNLIFVVALAGWMSHRLIAEPATAPANPAQYTPLDMKSVVNMDWRDAKTGDGIGGWTDQGSSNDMRGVKPGTLTAYNIPFDLIDADKNNHKAVVTLQSIHFKQGLPSVVINVNHKARSIYFLHVAAWSTGHMADYIVTYDDGSNVSLPIIDHQQICNWWNPGSGPAYRPAMHIPNGQTDNAGMVVFGWDNPSPDKAIKTIELKSTNDQGIDVIAAITLSDQAVALPDPKDVPTPDYLKSDLDALDKSQWFAVPSDVDKFDPSPIDQSSLMDVPAGKHGFMKNVDGHFVFDDGTPVKIIATGQAPIIPESKERAAYTARWLAKYGFNMVRFHPLQDEVTLHDADNTTTLDPAKMEILDYYIDQLAKNGIYVRFSMLYYHHVKSGDGIDHFAEAIDEERAAAKAKDPKAKDSAITTLNTMGITFFDPSVQKANIALERAIMTHKNPYRNNVMYGQDPAICQIETTNEDGMFFYTIDAIPKVFGDELNNLWGQWLLKKYGSRDKLAAAWGADLKGEEDPNNGTVKRLKIWALAKATDVQRARASDQLHYYYELNNAYFTMTKQALRDAGVKQPMDGTCWFGIGDGYWTEQASNVPNMDFIDRHHYWGGGPGGWQILPGQMFNTTCALKNPEEILKLGQERVMDLPFTISEWTNVLPNQSRLEAPPLMTYYGQGLGGWDAPIHFSNDMSGANNGFYRLLKWMWPVGDPSILCQYPAMAMIIRRGDITEAKPAFVRNISDEQLFSAKPLPDAAVKIDISGIFEMSSAEQISEKEKLPMYAAAVGKTGVHFSKEAMPDFSIDLNKYIDLKDEQIRSTTGQLFWDYKRGYVTANTPRTQAAVGYFGGIPIKLADCEIDTNNLISSIAVVSWDDKPLSESKHILVMAVGRARNTGMAYSRLGSRLLTLGETPILLEGVKGTITLNRTGNVKVEALSPYGYKTVDVSPKVENGKIVIPIDGVNKAAYYDITFN